ncbi:uncharacterized protein QC761_0003740 [Podospora bellae-mahoneyi]|uniref:Transmembrane protein n=1 Tax=Podospora bellae-mahoneyi TaxID=2093777 RepID=A0ABR0FXL0_9PEZI|nr:hypothetical protein QC761_0003740 [Podospora bellae-mahoneyi]
MKFLSLRFLPFFFQLDMTNWKHGIDAAAQPRIKILSCFFTFLVAVPLLATLTRGLEEEEKEVREWVSDEVVVVVEEEEEEEEEE